MYWATELEAGALVWALGKLRQYFDDGTSRLVKHYFALETVLQIQITEKQSHRLNEW